MLLLIFLGIHLALLLTMYISSLQCAASHGHMALAVCWATLWAGLLFFRGDLGMGGSIFVSICILVVNTAFAVWGCIRLVRELALENDIVGKVIRIGKRFSRNGPSETSNTSGNPLYGKVRSDIRKPKEIAEKERDKSGEGEGNHTNPIVLEMVELKREAMDVEIMDIIPVEKKRLSLKPIPKEQRASEFSCILGIYDFESAHRRRGSAKCLFFSYSCLSPVAGLPDALN